MRLTTKNSGFTLVEIIVVVSIIGILSAVVFINVEETRAKSRDASRAASLQQLQVAIELYEDQYGVYPDAGCGVDEDHWAGPGPQTGFPDIDSCADYIVGHTAGVNFVPDFIAELPTDPSSEDEDTEGFIYRTNADNSAYKAMVYQSVEVDTVDSYADPLARCPRNSTTGGCGVSPEPNSYAIYSAGAEDW